MRWATLFRVSWQRYLPDRSPEVQEFEGGTDEIMRLS